MRNSLDLPQFLIVHSHLHHITCPSCTFQEVVSIVGISPDAALKLLLAADNDVSRALNHYFTCGLIESSGPETSAASSAPANVSNSANSVADASLSNEAADSNGLAVRGRGRSRGVRCE